MGTFQRGINNILGEVALATATAKRIGDKKAEKQAKLVKKSQAKPKNTVDMQEANKKTQEIINQKAEQKRVYRKRRENILQRIATQKKTEGIINQKFEREMKPYA